jgi:diguanylate cyclase (GGDEF)-like protein
VWIVLVLKSRPSGRVTHLLVAGLGCLFFSWWIDTLDEFIQLPDTIAWDHWLESVPMPIGMLLLTLGIYHWHHEQLAISAQMAKREKLFRDYRLFDKVTPLGGADYLRQQLDIALQQARHQQQPLSLLMLDIDDFSAVNRRYGFAEGDQVLQAVTQVMLLNLRRHDLLFRLAGDRFVALLPATGERQARALSQDLKAAVDHFAYHTQQQGERVELRVTCVAVMATQDSAESLLQRLNLALAYARQPPYAHSA